MNSAELRMFSMHKILLFLSFSLEHYFKVLLDYKGGNTKKKEEK